jgi:hypothetical protein
MSSYRCLCLAGSLVAVVVAGCATGGSADGDGGLVDQADAPSGSRADADPFEVDAAMHPEPDAAPVDAAPVDAAPPPDAPPGTPDAAPLPPDACVDMTLNLLQNPGFDLGPGGGWAETSAGGFPIITAAIDLPVPPQAGTHAAWLGGYPSASDEFLQTVVIPPDATALRLKGFKLFASQETGGPADLFIIQIRNGGGTVLEPLASLSNVEMDAAFAAFDFPAASPHAGETVQIYMRGTTNANALNTNFFIDSLAFEVTVCR